MSLARVSLEFGDEKGAMSFLLRGAKRRALQDEAFAIYGHWRGVPVPDGGFVVVDGEFLTPEEHANRRKLLEVRRRVKGLVSCRAAELGSLVEGLGEFGSLARRPVQEALRKRYEKRRDTWKELPGLRRPRSVRQAILKELDQRREVALALIFNRELYPYPYGPNQKKVQGEVDALVQAVRTLWDTPSVWLLKNNRGLKGLYDELVAARRLMDPAFAERPSPAAMLTEIDRFLDMHTWGVPERDRKYNEAVQQFNDAMLTSMTEAEKACHRLTNAYRVMMGRRALKVEETLVLAARSHSQEMKDLGYFSHNSPTKGRETPTQRARLNGWTGSCSENIARGQQDAAGAVQGWLSSSGHHRNILGRGWTVLGCGRAKDGPFWTQNFAAGSSTRLSQKKKKEKKSSS